MTLTLNLEYNEKPQFFKAGYKDRKDVAHHQTYRFKYHIRCCYRMTVAPNSLRPTSVSFGTRLGLGLRP